MAAACCYRADASSAELVFRMRAGSYDEDSLIDAEKFVNYTVSNVTNAQRSRIVLLTGGSAVGHVIAALAA
jgi:hypothetical protein